MTPANGQTFQSTKNRRSRLTALSLIWFLWNVKEPTQLFQKSKGSQTPVVWPISPGLGGLSVRFTVIGHKRNRHEGVYLPPHNNSAIIDFVYLPGTVTSSLNCQDSTLCAISFSWAVLACGRRSRSSHARKNLWYPGYIIWNLIQPVNRPLVERGTREREKRKGLQTNIWDRRSTAPAVHQILMQVLIGQNTDC